MIRCIGAGILLVSSLLSLSMAASKEESVMDTEQAKVLAVVETMTAAFHNQDIDGVLASYETGAAVNFEPGKKITDPAVIRQMFEGAFNIDPTFSYPNGHEVYTSNDLALHIAPWIMQGKAADGSEIKQTGLSVSVLRKQQNGQWLLVLDNPHGQLLIAN